jgi:hypothetical protein
MLLAPIHNPYIKPIFWRIHLTGAIKRMGTENHD